MIKINWLKERIQSNDYFFSKHGDQERQNDNLSIAEVEDAILQGYILEQYPDTGRGLSCLIIGFTKKGIPVHIVCGTRGNSAVIITVYIPSPPKFKNPFERG
jgi:uncharacterized protein YcgI (DUF1989 family)